MTIAIVGKILFWAWIGSETLVLLLTLTHKSEGKVQDRGSMQLVMGVIFSAIYLGEWIGATDRGVPMHVGHWMRYVVVGLMAVGLAIRWTAILTLGRSFSVNVAIHATQTLQRSGLFRWMRHPSYTGMMVLFLAIGLDTRNWVSLGIIVALPMAALLYRMHVEEAALTGAFGDEYVEYSRETKRLIPGVY
ncbi:MAG: isoprenylcysteine carboxylmethyltransferase family protein [Acidobacteriaceae bacterium]